MLIADGIDDPLTTFILSKEGGIGFYRDGLVNKLILTCTKTSHSRFGVNRAVASQTGASSHLHSHRYRTHYHDNEASSERTFCEILPVSCA
jgi:hypothetical protein